MKFSVSDLPFGSFSKAFLKALPMQYDIEIFYEFGTDHYWDYVLKDLKEKRRRERRFSIHGPCVAVNLADLTTRRTLMCTTKPCLRAEDKCGVCGCAQQRSVAHGRRKTGGAGACVRAY